jgi:Zn-finger nucleic acid-binding protein
MRQYERAGVTIDQCSECRGIFLDRGELERLVDAEENYQRQSGGGHGAPPSAPGYPSHGAPYPPQPGYSPQPSYPPQQHGYPAAPGYGSHGSAYSSHGYQHGHRRHKGHRRRKSVFDDLFG